MSEYTITSCYGKFKYPSHFKIKNGDKNYFEDHIPMWNDIISKTKLKEKEKTIVIEIGSLHGGCSVWLLETLLNKPNDFLHCIDINETEYLKNNLQPYKNVKLHLGMSTNILTELWHTYKNPIANLIYIDGSHVSKHVLEDAVLSWKLLKNDGIMIFDDYGWGSDSPIECQPKTGIDAFLHGYQKHYELIHTGWQICIKKIKYEISSKDLNSNYAHTENPYFNKTNY